MLQRTKAAFVSMCVHSLLAAYFIKREVPCALLGSWACDRWRGACVRNPIPGIGLNVLSQLSHGLNVRSLKSRTLWK